MFQFDSSLVRNEHKQTISTSSHRPSILYSVKKYEAKTLPVIC